MLIAAGRVLAVGVVAVALAVSTPVVGWCASAQHQLQTLHPLFDHEHHHPATQLAEAASESESGTGWTAATYGMSSWAPGAQALPATGLALRLPPARSFGLPPPSRPLEHVDGPRFPPPR
jgi:hypothetical protein